MTTLPRRGEQLTGLWPVSPGVLRPRLADLEPERVRSLKETWEQQIRLDCDGCACGKKGSGAKAESARAAENPEAAAGEARGARASVGLASEVEACCQVCARSRWCRRRTCDVVVEQSTTTGSGKLPSWGAFGLLRWIPEQVGSGPCSSERVPRFASSSSARRKAPRWPRTASGTSRRQDNAGVYLPKQEGRSALLTLINLSRPKRQPAARTDRERLRTLRRVAWSSLADNSL